MDTTDRHAVGMRGVLPCNELGGHMTKKLLAQALEFLEDNQHLVADNERHAYVMEYNSFIEQLKEALAKQEQRSDSEQLGEPVAWMKEQWSPDCGPYVDIYRDDEMGWRDRKEWTPLYAAPQSKQEPVGFIRVSENKHPYATLQKCYDTNGNVFKGGEPLYTTPQQRTAAEGEDTRRAWVGLTYEEIDYQAKKDDHAVYFALGALWAEAKLKEKNT
jgi:hypothetical protein